MIRIGTSGFHYNDWKGNFYPSNVAKSQWFDHYSREFDCVELNASYYAWLTERTVLSLVARAPAGFSFTVKLHRSLTHERDDRESAIRKTKEQNRPFAESGMLGTTLAQFPNSFRHSKTNEDYIAWLAYELAPLNVEFRHESWHRSSDLYRKVGVGAVCVDEPEIPGLVPWDVSSASEIGYVRFHGRNAAAWYNHEHSFERYDYLYSLEQLEGRVPDIQTLSAETSATYVFFNNHYGAQAVTNARQLKGLLGLGGRKNPQLF